MVKLAFAPLVAWFVSGVLKLMINSLRARRLVLSGVGYGGMPSTHSAIVSSAVAGVIWREGLNASASVVAIALAGIVIMDALGLRNQIGRHATLLNQLEHVRQSAKPLRERVGHRRIEVLAGILVGSLVGIAVASLAGH